MATPIRWEELKSPLRSDSFTVANLQARLSKRQSDPWKDYDDARATLTAGMKKI